MQSPPSAPWEWTMTDAITHGGTDRSYRLCRCHSCGQESECTPMNDFYTLPSDDHGYLYCERCVMWQPRKDATFAGAPDDCRRRRSLARADRCQHAIVIRQPSAV